MFFVFTMNYFYHFVLCFPFLPVDPNAPNVQVTRLTLMCETAPLPLTLDLQGEWSSTVVVLVFGGRVSESLRCTF